MKIGELITIKTVDDKKTSDISDEKHTPYAAEIRLFSCVQAGDIDQILDELKNLQFSVNVGRMSEDDIMQYKYMAVSAITLATRYAIQGGVNEAEAFRFSDRVIMTVDSMDTKEKILLFLAGEILELTKTVKKCKEHPIHSPHIRKCVRLIDKNLNKKLSVTFLADSCGISCDYLSQIFKKEMGENLSSYIARKKLQKAKEMLLDKCTNEQICKELKFSSHSHFITAFKKQYNMTPSEFIRLSRK